MNLKIYIFQKAVDGRRDDFTGEVDALEVNEHTETTEMLINEMSIDNFEMDSNLEKINVYHEFVSVKKI